MIDTAPTPSFSIVPTIPYHQALSVNVVPKCAHSPKSPGINDTLIPFGITIEKDIGSTGFFGNKKRVAAVLHKTPLNEHLLSGIYETMPSSVIKLSDWFKVSTFFHGYGNGFFANYYR